jgi:DNA-binding response OmpR family regulator
MEKRILIVEDDESIQDVLRIILQHAGYEVVSHPDGKAIMLDNFEKPDLFLLDKQLGGIDGLDICRYLKTNQFTKNIPVVMISANPQIASLSKLAGANGYIEKPFNMSHLLNTIKAQLEHSTELV